MTTDIWTDPSALWNTWTDLSRNGDIITEGFYYGVNSLAYDSSNNVMVSGGCYYSNNKEFLEPFISYKTNTDTIWSDPSAIQFNPNWTDLYNGPPLPLSQFPIFLFIKYGVNALAYDSSNQVMYAGGSYFSQNFESLATPFIVSNSNPLDSNGWSDPSAIWNNPNWTDLSSVIFEDEDENSFAISGSVKCFAYDSSNNTMYAGGTYYSNSRESFVPFIVYNSTPLDPNGWSDPSAIWNNPNWTDLSSSNSIPISGFVNSLAYDSLHNTMCAGGSYFSNSTGWFVPFIVYNSTPLDPNGWSDPSAIQFNPNWTDLSDGTGSNQLAAALLPIYGINSLKYDSSSNIMYSGGSYYSNTIDLDIVPFIVSNNNSSNPNGWTNPSSLSSNLNWTTNNSFGGIINSLEFDSLNEVMYASGTYGGLESGLIPFIVSNVTPLDPNGWTNPNGLSLSPNWTDLSNTLGFEFNGIVNVLANDSSTNLMYAGGNYLSNGTGSKEPFIVYNNRTISPENPICFKKGTKIMTPDGFVLIEQLKKGDLISSKQGNITIKKMIDFIGTKDKSPLYCLRKDSIGKNKPINDLYMSADHAFKTNGVWYHMKCSPIAKKMKDADNIHYYHISIDNYFTHTINAEGIEVETCFNPKKDDGIYMLWNCTKECCIPLQCRLASKSDIIRNNNNNNKTKVIMPLKKEAVVKYDNTLLYIEINNTKIPLLCSEIELPQKKKEIKKNNFKLKLTSH